MRKRFPKDMDNNKNEARSEGMRELFVMRPGELPMKTETPPGKIDPFVLMEVVEYAFSLRNGKKHPPLSEVYRKAHDIRMISKSRKGRIEIEKILAVQGAQEIEEFGI